MTEPTIPAYPCRRAGKPMTQAQCNQCWRENKFAWRYILDQGDCMGANYDRAKQVEGA